MNEGTRPAAAYTGTNHYRPRVEIADEVKTEFFGRVTDHDRIRKGPGEQVLGKLHLLVDIRNVCRLLRRRWLLRQRVVGCAVPRLRRERRLAGFRRSGAGALGGQSRAPPTVAGDPVGDGGVQPGLSGPISLS